MKENYYFYILVIGIFCLNAYHPVLAQSDFNLNNYSENSTTISLIHQEDLLTYSNNSVIPKQVDRLSQQEESLTDAEKKISSDLLQQIKPNLQLNDSKLMNSRTSMILSNQLLSSEHQQKLFGGSFNDSVYVYVFLNSFTSTSVVDPYVIQVTNRDENNHIAVAWIERNRLLELASLDNVRSIRTVTPPVTRSGSVMTEGDRIHKSENVRSLYGYRGSGVKIGIISTGVDHLADSQARGDLPGTVHVLSNTQGGDEGTAMLEIVHDVAPDAELYFHDCGSNIIAFNHAVDDLVASGCTIICDDIAWYSEPYFEDGIVAQHVASVITNNNILYISAAGNDAQQHYQGIYYNDGSNWHDFSHGNPELFKILAMTIPPGESVTIFLQWNDKFGLSSNNYNLYLKDPYSGDILLSSTTYQNGDDDPIEIISGKNVGSSTITAGVYIENYHGLAAQRELELFIQKTNGVWIIPYDIIPYDSIFGHPAVSDVIAVGAIDAFDPGNDDIEPYSSRGTVSLYYPTPIGREKPDLVGIDNVTITGVGGFGSPFKGTSAAAPHIAGIAAQIWGAYPQRSANEIRNLLYTTAVDLGGQFKNSIFGYGRADALAAAQTLIPPPINPSGKILVNQSQIISYPGYYVLTGDIIDFTNPDCFDIQSSNVIFDGFGHTVNGRNLFGVYPVGFFVNNPSNTIYNVTIFNVTISECNYGVYLKNAESSFINNLMIYNSVGGSANGIYIYQSHNISIKNNALTDNQNYGIWSRDSDNILIENNSIYPHHNLGITTTGSSNLTINSNFVSGCGQGITLSNGINSVISNNVAKNNYAGAGVGLWSITNTKIFNNYIEDNANGISITSSSNNLFYNNYIKNPTNLYGSSGPNTWNITKQPGINIIGGFFLGGNYWATPTNDGFSQTYPDLNFDGICDDPFSLTSGNIDMLPLGGVHTPISNFSANVTSGISPLTVQFNDRSLNNPVSWNWSFGDGFTSPLQNPVHTYTIGGNYSVSLNVSNAAGSSLLVKVGFINMTGDTFPPIGNFTADITSGIAPLIVRFTDLSTGSPNVWNWSFGDGYLSTSQNPVHNYTVLGNYSVTLQVTNAIESNITTKKNFIIVTAAPVAPVANFTGVPTSGTFPLTVTFMDTSIGTPTKWNWSFGDRSLVNATIQSPVHTFTSAGNYTVCLNATNAGGSNVSVRTNYITVNLPAPVTNFIGLPTSGTAPLIVTFTDISTNIPTSWNWSFGDGNSSTIQNPVHVYAFPGIYTVGLNAQNARGSNISIKSNYVVAIIPPLVANFSTSSSSGTIPLTVRFNDTSTGSPISWNWSFGDGYLSTSQNPIQTYNLSNSYTVLLTISNSTGTMSTSQGHIITAFPKGDFNGNNRVDIGDVTSVAYMAVGLIQKDPNANFNHDTDVDIADAAIIAYYYVGKIPEL